MASVSRTDALSRLRESWEQLNNARQGQTSDELAALFQMAASNDFVRHPERDVRLWSAKCLVEGLRVFAPTPPLTVEMLQAVLELFTEQVASLAELQGASLIQTIGLLEQLSEIHAFVLIYDCSEPGAMLTSLVSACLRAARAAGSGPWAGLLSKVLIDVLHEADEFPKPMLKRLIADLSAKRRVGTQTPIVARQVFTSLANRSAVAQAINDILATAMSEANQDADLADECDSTPPLDFESAMEVVYELFTLEPLFVSRVVVNLNAELGTMDPQRRCMVTRAVGQMISHCDVNNGHSLIESHPLLVDRYIERYDDADDNVRLAALDGALGIIKIGANMPADRTNETKTPIAIITATHVREQLVDRCLDPAMAVRLRAIEIVAEAAFSPEGLSFLGPVLPVVFRRTFDKKQLVREACLEAAASLYKLHALPLVVEGRFDDAKLMSWVPEIFCEAYAVFAGGRLGHTSELEELLERCLLGCEDYSEPLQRTLALIGFYSCVSSKKDAAKGLSLLLGRKHEANELLQQFVTLRVSNGGPMLIEMSAETLVWSATSTGTDDVTKKSDTQSGKSSAALKMILALANVLPVAESKNATNPEPVVLIFRRLDAVRDRTFWSVLQYLLGCNSQQRDSSPLTTSELKRSLVELDRLLRLHQLTDFVHILRRALLSTWVLPDQVSAMLEIWHGSSPISMALSSHVSLTSRQLAEQMARHFPRSLMPHSQTLVKHLGIAAEDDASCTLRILAILGKQARSLDEHLRTDTTTEFGVCVLVDALIRAPAVVVADSAELGSCHRKVVRALGILPSSKTPLAVERILEWAKEQLARSDEPARRASALRFAGACFAYLPEELQQERSAALDICVEVLKAGRIQELGSHPVIEIFAVLGEERQLEKYINDNCGSDDCALGTFAFVCALRAIRHGLLKLSTSMLSCLALHCHRLLVSGACGDESEIVLTAMIAFQKALNLKMRVVDRLRLCTTLPTMFAVSASRYLKDEAQRMLQTSLARAMRQSLSQQEPLLDFAVACFLHFLSRQTFFVEEASALQSAFPESSRVAEYFVDALLRVDPSKNTEISGAALRVVEGSCHFQDREMLDVTLMDKAANVIRHVLEKRCPELASTSSDWRRSSVRVGMPAELFVARQGHATAPTFAIHAVPESMSTCSAPETSLKALPPTTLLSSASVAHQSSSNEQSVGGTEGPKQLFQHMGRVRQAKRNKEVPSSKTLAVRGVTQQADVTASVAAPAEPVTPQVSRSRRTEGQTPRKRCTRLVLANLASMASSAKKPDASEPHGGETPKKNCSLRESPRGSVKGRKKASESIGSKKSRGPGNADVNVHMEELKKVIELERRSQGFQTPQKRAASSSEVPSPEVKMPETIPGPAVKRRKSA